MHRVIIVCKKNTCEQIKTLDGIEIGCCVVLNKAHIQLFFLLFLARKGRKPVALWRNVRENISAAAPFIL